MRRPTVQVTLECQNSCPFCAQRGTKAHVLDADLFPQLEALRPTSEEVTFIGGEPTLAPRLPELIAEAKRLGFKGIGLQTNGRRLADRGYFAGLVAAGLTDVHLSIHGAEAAIHDYHTGAPGSLTEIRQALAHARSLGVITVATTVVSRSNYRVLTALPPFLAGNGVSAWLLLLPRVAGALGAEDRITPRLAMALQGVRQAVDASRRAQLAVWVEGAPLCMLGPLVPFSLPNQPERAYAPVCAQCPSRARCPGVDPVYLERFHGDELVARATAVEHFDSPRTALFVGIGELVPPQPRAPMQPVVPVAAVPAPAAPALVSLALPKA